VRGFVSRSRSAVARYPYFKLRYPDALVVAVEPDPSTFARLAENARQFDGVILRQAAISAADGEAELVTRAGSLASSLKRSGSRAATVRVSTVTIDRLLDDLGLDQVDVLKLDVEGAELDALRCFEGIDRVSAVVGEVHPELIGAPTKEFFSLLDGFELDARRAGPSSVTFTAVNQRARAGRTAGSVSSRFARELRDNGRSRGGARGRAA
jgi:FkbM family methyltransferase